MIELIRTTDPVRLSFVRARLAEEGIEALILDVNAGALFGSAIAMRVMVDEDDLTRARAVLGEEGDSRAG